MAKVKVRGWVALFVRQNRKSHYPLFLCTETKLKCLPYAGYSKLNAFPTFPTVITLCKPWKINCSRFVFGKVFLAYCFHLNAVGLR